MSDADVPLVSVVIPAFHRPEKLRRAVSSLCHQKLAADRFEVLVVDSSLDESNQQVIAELQTQMPFRLQFHRKEPEGPGPSRNLGVRHARAPRIAFMDSDCEATPAWLKAGLAAFQPRTGLVQGRTLPDPNVDLGVFVHTLVIDQENHVYETCNMFYRREAFDQAGGFPVERDLDALSEYVMGGEDTELAWKVKRQGWESCFAEEALVYHEVVPISVVRWLYAKRLMIWPRVLRRIPELRRHFVAGLFYDRAQALFTLALCGFLAALISPWFLVMMVPYIWFRATEQTRSLPGIKRVLRVGAYGLKDAISFVVLVIGSIRFRSPLL